MFLLLVQFGLDEWSSDNIIGISVEFWIFGFLVQNVESVYSFFQIFNTKSFVDLFLVTTPKSFTTDGRNWLFLRKIILSVTRQSLRHCGGVPYGLLLHITSYRTTYVHTILQHRTQHQQLTAGSSDRHPIFGLHYLLLAPPIISVGARYQQQWPHWSMAHATTTTRAGQDDACRPKPKNKQTAMNMYPHIFFYIVIGVSWMLPSSHSFSFSHTSLRRMPPIPTFVGVEPYYDYVWRNANRHRIDHCQSRSQCNKSTYYHNMMLPMLPMTITEEPLKSTIYISIYIFTTNMAYLVRRSHIRNMPKRKLLQIRLAREAGVSLSLYVTNITIWQLFVTILFPILELILGLFFRHVSYYYFYTNASGCGIILEPLTAQSLSMSERAKHQIRFDWHRFSVNVGAIGRDGYRHPPSISKNAPHIDIPRRGLKHWPWRRRHVVAKGGLKKGRWRHTTIAP